MQLIVQNNDIRMREINYKNIPQKHIPAEYMNSLGFKPSFTRASFKRVKAISSLGGLDLLQIEIAFTYV